MKNDEFAFFNQQLAAMVRDGIPLEAALSRLCADMRAGKLRTELEKLNDDLARGIPLREAVKARELPELYRQMLEVGAQSNDLSGVLTLLADHYQRSYIVAARLKGLMVYPAIVLVCAFLLSCFLGLVLTRVFREPLVFSPGSAPARFAYFGTPTWLPPVVLAVAVAGFFVALTAPAARRALRWRLPAFKEASLAQIASAMAMMLKSGVPLNNALGLMEQLEQGTPGGTELGRWRKRLAEGQGKFPEIANGGKVFPPLFVWTIAQAHEDLTAGFQRAAELFRARAAYRTEVLLYSALPCSVLALGLVIISQTMPVVLLFIATMSWLSDMND